MTSGKRILVGEILKAHGLKGEVKLKSFTAEPMRIAAYGALADEKGGRVTIASLRAGPGALIARIEGVATREGAEALHGTKLYLARDKLPEAETGAYYHADLIGLVAREGAREVGRVRAVYDFGAGGVIEIEREGADTLLVPFSDEMVPEVNVAGGYLRLAAEAVS